MTTTVAPLARKFLKVQNAAAVAEALFIVAWNANSNTGLSIKWFARKFN
jgi:hypothetical protein